MKRIDSIEQVVSDAVVCALGGMTLACNLEMPDMAFFSAIVFGALSIIGNIQSDRKRTTQSLTNTLKPHGHTSQF